MRGDREATTSVNSGCDNEDNPDATAKAAIRIASSTVLNPTLMIVSISTGPCPGGFQLRAPYCYTSRSAVFSKSTEAAVAQVRQLSIDQRHHANGGTADHYTDEVCGGLSAWHAAS